MYLNDGLGAAAGMEEACVGSELVRALSIGRGCGPPTKSVWKPTSCLTWLTFVIDLAEGVIRVPESKIVTLRSTHQEAKRSSCVRAKTLASILGKIMSRSLAFGPETRFMSRSLYSILESRESWYESLQFSPEDKAKLVIWASNLEEYNTQPIWHSPGAVRVVYSDARDTGFGGYVVEHGPGVSHGQWTAQEAHKSSTWRELSTVYLVLLSIATKLVDARVRWFKDNQNVV